MISNHHSSILPEPAVAAFKKVNELEKSVASLQKSVVDDSVEVKQVPLVSEDVQVKADKVDLSTPVDI